MSKYEVVVTLFTIVYGLMITDLFLSFHKLIRKRRKIIWNWLPILSAWYLFLIILKNWWDLMFMQGSTDWINIFFFVAYGHLLFLIFLMVSSVLPNKINRNEVNLKDYYFQNHRYFWGLMSSVVVVSSVISLIKTGIQFDSISLSNILGSTIFLILTVILAITKKYWTHSVILSLLIIQIGIELINK